MPNTEDSDVATPAVEENIADSKATDEPAKEDQAKDVTSGAEQDSGADVNGVQHVDTAEQADAKPKKGRKRKSEAKSSPSKRQSIETPGRTSSRLKNQASGTKLSTEISSDNLPKSHRRRSQATDEERPSEVAA